MTKKIVIITISLICVLGGYFLINHYFFKETIQSRSFGGGLVSVNSTPEKTTITVAGNFISEEHPEVARDPKTVTITLDSKTQITRVMIAMPSEEELRASGGYFDGRDLKRESGSGSIETLIQDFNDELTTHINILVKTKDNIYNKDKFIASEIKYEVIQ